MTQDFLSLLNKQQDSLIKYIRRQPDVLDYYAYSPIEECGHCVPRGVVVACDMNLLFKLQSHTNRYYPDMVIVPMTVAEYIGHTNRPYIGG